MLQLTEEIPDSSCTNTNKHLIEFWTGTEEKWDPCFSGNGSCKERFTSSRRANQQDTWKHTQEYDN